MCPSASVFTLSNMNISKSSGSIAIKSYLKHYLGGGKAALGFRPDRIRTLVWMTADSSHRVHLMGVHITFNSVSVVEWPPFGK